MHELRGAPELSLAELLARMTPVDLVIVEGFKRDRHPKLEIHRSSVGKPLLCREDETIRGIATDVPVPGLPVPRIALDDVPVIARFVLEHAQKWPS
jgi:molybdopterin-guanine dinucleotide biosynthesis protein MobB